NRSHTDTVATSFGYDTSGRLTSVTLPAPDGATTSERPQKNYSYGPGTTSVEIVGLTDETGAPVNPASTVSYDPAWRATSTTSAMGLTSSQSWNSKDQVLSSTDAWGRTSTTIYDEFTDLATDSYGPAPTSCFGTDRKPVSSCPIAVGHTSTAYDQGLHGLQTSYFATPTLSGRPVDFSLGLMGGTGATGTGLTSRAWAAGSPGSGIPAENFSLRLTGVITFPTAGDYKL